MSGETAGISPGRQRLLVWIGSGIVLLAGGAGWRVYQQRLPARIREQARVAEARGRWEAVNAATRELIALDPHDDDAWLTQARALAELGDTDGAVRTLDEMPPVRGPQLNALRTLAELLLGPRNAPRAAEQSLLRILELDPQSEYACQRLLSYYALTLQRRPLVDLSHAAMARRCEPIETYLYLFFADELDFTNGVELNRRWLQQEPGSELFRVAEAYHLAHALAGGAPREDLEFVKRIRQLADNLEDSMARLLSQYPSNLELLAWQIERQIERGDVDAVTDLLSRLPGAADTDNRFWRYSGWAKARLDSPEAAAADFATALRLNPLDWATRNQLAAVLRQQQRFDEVVKLQELVTRARELARAIKVLPDVRSVPPELLQQLAEYAADCGDQRFAEGLREYLQRHHSPAETPHMRESRTQP